MASVRNMGAGSQRSTSAGSSQVTLEQNFADLRITSITDDTDTDDHGQNHPPKKRATLYHETDVPQTVTWNKFAGQQQKKPYNGYYQNLSLIHI